MSQLIINEKRAMEWLDKIEAAVGDGKLKFHLQDGWKGRQAEIRSETGACPVCALANLELAEGEPRFQLRYWEVAPRLGMEASLASFIAAAADEPGYAGRQWVLKACGLGKQESEVAL